MGSFASVIFPPLLLLAAVAPVIATPVHTAPQEFGIFPSNNTCKNDPSVVNFPPCTIQSVPMKTERVTIRAACSLNTLRDRLFKEVGSPSGAPISLKDLRASIGSGTTGFEGFIKSHIGPSGFMLFQVLYHGAWFDLYGYNSIDTITGKKPSVSKGMMAVTIGNPLLLKAIAQNPNAGYGVFLVRPPTVLLYDKGNSKESFIQYDKLSTDFTPGGTLTPIVLEVYTQDVAVSFPPSSYT